MIRIRGQVGAWPVDLTLELDAADWQQLRRAVTLEAVEPAPQTPQPATDTAQALALIKAQQPIEGPALLEALSAMTGSSAAAKRLMLVLRHSEQVQITQHGQVTLWQLKA